MERLKRYEEAIECYEKASDESLKISPKNGGAWYRKGCVLVKLDRYEVAIECFNYLYQNR